MKYPCLVLKQFCKTEVHIEIEQEGQNVYGEQLDPVVRQWKDGAHSRTEAYTA